VEGRRLRLSHQAFKACIGSLGGIDRPWIPSLRKLHENRVSNCNVRSLHYTAYEITMKTLARWAIAVGTTAWVAGAFAAGAPVPSTPEEVLELPPEFTGADEDEDGYINVQEAEAIPGLSTVFALLDHDQNCGIDLEEYRYGPWRRQP
jgi:hypothetical protein